MPTPVEILKQYWGYDAFRPLQEDIVQSALDGFDTLALLPTGGGKSICFQVPALAREGVCVVVSPLIALMKDQVAQLQRRGIAAVALHAGMAYRDIDRLLDNCVFGGVKFLYLSPERLTTELLRARLPRMNVNLLAIDEAHCISQWGYDFRPPYLNIAEIRAFFPNVPVLALTATATPEVVTDIQEKLAFRPGSRVFQKSFSRSNLAYVVRPAEGKESRLADILKKVPGSAVVYVRNRRRTKEIARELERLGISAGYYHAGLDLDERSARQEAWINNQLRVMVSTNAFGMGIDKPDVRLVVHMDLPDSLEAYFQEAGRAGRDEKKAYAVLLYQRADAERLVQAYEQSFPDMAEIRRVYQALGSYYQLATGAGQGQSFDFDLAAFSHQFQFDSTLAYHCLKALEQADWLTLTEAVFTPATVQIVVDKDTLYDYQLRHPELDRILKTILRTYQGAFSHPVAVREKQLATFLKMPVGILRKSLETLHNAGIVDYQPAKDQPQLIFQQERVEAASLSIDQQRYRFRKQRHLERMKAAIAYAETPACRSRQLLAYFGETDAPNCGVCDYCLALKKKALNPELFRQYEQKITERLAAGPLPLQQLVAAFVPAQHEHVLQVLAFLIDEGKLVQDGEMIGVEGV